MTSSGREVGDGADEHAPGRGVLGVGADRLREAEVGDLDGATVRLVGDEDVLRLHVTVDQPGPVRGGERGDDRLEQGQRPRGRHRGLLAQDVAEGVARDVLHHQEDRVGAVGGVVALVVDTHDVGVVEAGGGARLTHEALGELLVVAEPGVHHLDRDGAVEPGVGGLVDTGHATASHPGEDAVAAVQQPSDQGVARRRRARLRGRARVAPLIDLQAGPGARRGRIRRRPSYGSSACAHAQARFRRGARRGTAGTAVGTQASGRWPTGLEASLDRHDVGDVRRVSSYNPCRRTAPRPW